MYIICTYVIVYINIYTKYYVGVPSQAEYSPLPPRSQTHCLLKGLDS